MLGDLLEYEVPSEPRKKGAMTPLKHFLNF